MAVRCGGHCFAERHHVAFQQQPQQSRNVRKPHIDSRTQGLGPYAELLRVERGARIVVRSRHLVQRFAVTSLRVFPRTSLAKTNDLFSPSGPRRLTMVTCAGPYDAAQGGYQNLAVVTARPVTQPASRDARR